MRGGSIWGLILSAAEAEEDGDENDKGDYDPRELQKEEMCSVPANRGRDRGTNRGEDGSAIRCREKEVRAGIRKCDGSHHAATFNNNEDSDCDDGDDDRRMADKDSHSHQSSSISSVTAFGNSAFTSNTDGNHRKKKLLLDEGNMRGVCENALSVIGQSHTLDITNRIIFGLRKEGGVSE